MTDLVINREHVKKTFADYTSLYDASNEKIRLKIEHTYKVADICEQIARSEGLDDSETDLAWLLGMLHDVGRFEQIRQYGTFIDADSVDHAQFGADILFKQGRIRDYIPDNQEDDLIEKAIRVHNRYQVPENLSQREVFYADLLRDADKVDIIRVNVETPLEEIYNVTTEELKQAPVTPEVMQAFEEHHTIERSLMKASIDHVVGHIALVYGLVYKKSREIVKEQGFLDQIMNFESENKVTQKALKRIREVMKEYL